MNEDEARRALEAAPTDSRETLYKHYRRLIKVHHSDRRGLLGDSPSEARFHEAKSREINEAWHFLQRLLKHSEASAGDDDQRRARAKEAADEAEDRLKELIRILAATRAKAQSATADAVAAKKELNDTLRSIAEARSQQASAVKAAEAAEQRLADAVHSRAALGNKQGKRYRVSVVAVALMTLFGGAYIGVNSAEHPAPDNVILAENAASDATINWMDRTPDETAFEITWDGGRVIYRVAADETGMRIDDGAFDDSLCYEVRAVRESDDWTNPLDRDWTPPWAEDWVTPWPNDWKSDWVPARNSTCGIPLPPLQLPD